MPVEQGVGMLLTRRQWVSLSVASALQLACNARARADQEPGSRSSRVRVHGIEMAWREQGSGPLLVFLHGNPTSSHLWRHCLAVLGAKGFRCLAPDLIGMGASDKLRPSGTYRYSLPEHIAFLDGWFEAVVGASPHILIGHDWGGLLAFDRARRFASQVRGLCFMETFVDLMTRATTPAFAYDWFASFLTPESEHSVLADNHFVEQVFLKQFPDMGVADQAVYRAPFAVPGESRRATISWPRNVPLDGLPRSSAETFERALSFMARSRLPKLFVNAEPGGMIVGPRRDLVRRWPALTEVTVSSGHYVPEHLGAQLPALMLPWLSANKMSNPLSQLEELT